MNLCRLLTVFAVLVLVKGIAAQVAKKKSIFLSLGRNKLRTGDSVVLQGTFLPKRSVTRFFSNSRTCGVKRSLPHSHCQPLVIKMKPRRGINSIVTYYRGYANPDKDIAYENGSAVVPDVRVAAPFRLIVEVREASYVIKLNGNFIMMVADQVGHNEITEIRAYNGEFDEYYVSYNGRNDDPLDICGTRPGLSTLTARIVGGSDAKSGEFPWQAALRRKFIRSWATFKHLCGGSIISSCWILTAAHCVITVRANPSDYYFRVGDYYNADDNSYYSGAEDQQDLEIEHVIIHRNYSSEPTLKNDIALVKLRTLKGSDSCITFSKKVRPICLPNHDETFKTRQSCVISGWGALNWTHYPAELPAILQKAVVEIKDLDRCRQNYGVNSQHEEKVADHTICASGSGTDSCQGDSGGPLACPRPGGHFTLWGVTSWGEGCAKKNRPGIYTKVVDFLDWIQSHIHRLV